jgi:hypothetical protein
MTRHHTHVTDPVKRTEEGRGSSWVWPSQRRALPWGSCTAHSLRRHKCRFYASQRPSGTPTSIFRCTCRFCHSSECDPRGGGWWLERRRCQQQKNSMHRVDYHYRACSRLVSTDLLALLVWRCRVLVLQSCASLLGRGRRLFCNRLQQSDLARQYAKKTRRVP